MTLLLPLYQEKPPKLIDLIKFIGKAPSVRGWSLEAGRGVSVGRGLSMGTGTTVTRGVSGIAGAGPTAVRHCLVSVVVM